MTTGKLRAMQEVEAGRAFYAKVAPDLEVGHFATMWHIVSLGHHVEMDLDRIARMHGVSSADLHLMGTMRVSGTRRLRATDLAAKLRVSNAVLSGRVAKLERLGLLLRSRDVRDKRAFELELTGKGVSTVDALVTDISRRSHFVSGHLRLSAQDKAAVARVLGLLYDTMERDFVYVPRPDS